MNADLFIADLQLLSTMSVRMQIDCGQLAVMTYLYRSGEKPVRDIMAATGLSKSRCYRQLDYLEDKGAACVTRRVKEAYVEGGLALWGLTETGRRTVREIERLYRKSVIRLMDSMQQEQEKEQGGRHGA